MGAASNIEDNELEFEDEHQYGQNNGQGDPTVQSASVNADTNVKKNTIDGFLESLTFKNHISHRILCSLLDPNLPFYIQGTTSQFVRMYLVKYNAITMWTAKTKPLCWEWVDMKLVKLQKKLKQEQET
ncbi:hypothetical protein FRC06_005266 [Ceratobasidium sp. 370]|nr:hypothetical protein FRC06_005266 [Ceratobasidium sp. 370]